MEDNIKIESLAINNGHLISGSTTWPNDKHIFLAIGRTAPPSTTD
jgi:hypothetical protein